MLSTTNTEANASTTTTFRCNSKTQRLSDDAEVMGVCDYCEEDTFPKVKGSLTPQKYCSGMCRKIASADRRKRQPQAECVTCDIVFARDYNDSFSFCSTSCRKVFLSNIENEKEMTGKMHCQGFRKKNRYSSVYRAYEAASMIQDRTLFVYPCFECGAYHTGHQKGYELETLSRPQTYLFYAAGRKIMKKVRNSEVGFGLRVG